MTETEAALREALKIARANLSAFERNGFHETRYFRGTTRKTIAKIDAALALPSEGGWRDFASAPEDGTTILAFRPDAGIFTAVHCEADAHLSTSENPPEEDASWFSTSGEDLTGDLPTLWQPLPALPTTRSAPDGE